MSDHNLLLNESKTETLTISAPVSVCGCNIVSSPTIRNSRIMWTDNAVTGVACKSAYYHLYAISKIRHCLTSEACNTLVHSLVIPRLDYDNAVLRGITEALDPVADGAKFSIETDRKTAKTPAYYPRIDTVALGSG